MNLRYSLRDPHKITATLEITATLADFEKILKQIEPIREWPMSRLYGALSDLLRKAHASFASEGFTPDPPKNVADIAATLFENMGKPS